MFQLPTTSRTFNKIQPKTLWGWHEVFLSKVAFYLEMVIWQNDKPGYKAKASDVAKWKENKPKYVVPDFMKEPEEKSPLNDGSIAMEPHEIAQILALPRG